MQYFTFSVLYYKNKQLIYNLVNETELPNILVSVQIKSGDFLLPSIHSIRCYTILVSVFAIREWLTAICLCACNWLFKRCLKLIDWNLSLSLSHAIEAWEYLQTISMICGTYIFSFDTTKMSNFFSKFKKYQFVFILNLCSAVRNT